MAFCDPSHTFHKQVTNVSQHVFVILLWGISMFPLSFSPFECTHFETIQLWLFYAPLVYSMKLKLGQKDVLTGRIE